MKVDLLNDERQTRLVEYPEGRPQGKSHRPAFPATLMSNKASSETSLLNGSFIFDMILFGGTTVKYFRKHDAFCFRNIFFMISILFPSSM